MALKHSNEQSLEPRSFQKDENAARTGWIRTVGRAVVRQGNADNWFTNTSENAASLKQPSLLPRLNTTELHMGNKFKSTKHKTHLSVFSSGINNSALTQVLSLPLREKQM